MGDGLGLGDVYETTLRRIRAQEGEKAKLAMTTLMWICHSERPLRVDELCYALAVEITEVQRLSIVCSTSEVGCPYLLWNIQNLGAVPP